MDLWSLAFIHSVIKGRQAATWFAPTKTIIEASQKTFLEDCGPLAH